jgi:hypothetical protein
VIEVYLCIGTYNYVISYMYVLSLFLIVIKIKMSIHAQKIMSNARNSLFILTIVILNVSST